jgi:hypothetical protein
MNKLHLRKNSPTTLTSPTKSDPRNGTTTRFSHAAGVGK